MLDQRAELAFQQGVECLRRGRCRDALAYLRGAIEVDREQESHAKRRQARYLSYYGLGLALCGGSVREALQLCRHAAEREGYRAELWWNLGRVCIAAGKRGEAYRALVRAARIEPEHRGIARDLRGLGVRRAPVVPFLARGNPVNVLLGRMRRAG
jgi:tetratricopeptide (TPR) repeat protein